MVNNLMGMFFEVEVLEILKKTNLKTPVYHSCDAMKAGGKY